MHGGTVAVKYCGETWISCLIWDFQAAENQSTQYRRKMEAKEQNLTADKDATALLKDLMTLRGQGR